MSLNGEALMSIPKILHQIWIGPNEPLWHWSDG
jgi:hypothetical protein